MKIAFTLLFGLIAFFAKADSFILFKENGKVGIKNESGAIVIPASFQALGWSDGSFSVIGDITGYRIDQSWGIINLKKEFITSAVYESLVYAGGENIIAQKKISATQYKTGCINLRGEEKIPFQYDGIQIAGLRAVVFNLTKSRYQFGLRDLDHREIIPAIYKNITPLGSLRYAVQNHEGKIALFSDAGKPISDFSIDSISGFNKGYATLHQKLRQGLMDRNGTIVLEPIYKSIQVIDMTKAIVQSPDEWVLINYKNQILNRVSAENLIPAGDKFIVQDANRFGLADRTLKTIIPIQFEKLIKLDDAKWLIQKNNKFGVIDSVGNILLKNSYDSLHLNGSYYRSLTKNGWSLIALDGKELTYKYYSSIVSLRKTNLHPVNYRGHWGIINERGDEVIHCVYDSIVQFHNDLWVVKYKGNYGVINQKEDWLVAPQKFPIQLIRQGLYLLTTPENVFLKSLSGEILYFTNNMMRLESDFWIEVLPDGTEKTIDYEGRIVKRVAVEGNIQKVFTPSEGFTGIMRDGKFGFVDSRGRLRIANRYDSIQDFHEGLAAIKLIGRWGFINQEDNIIIHPNYDFVSQFKNGVVIATRNGRTGLINKEGKTILTFQYDGIESLASSNHLLHNKGLKGLADGKGNILMEPRFTSLREIENNMVIVERDGKFGVNSLTGMSIIPVDYVQLTFDQEKKIFLGLRKAEIKEITLN